MKGEGLIARRFDHDVEVVDNFTKLIYMKDRATNKNYLIVQAMEIERTNVALAVINLDE